MHIIVLHYCTVYFTMQLYMYGMYTQLTPKSSVSWSTMT